MATVIIFHTDLCASSLLLNKISSESVWFLSVNYFKIFLPYTHNRLAYIFVFKDKLLKDFLFLLQGKRLIYVLLTNIDDIRDPFIWIPSTSLAHGLSYMHADLLEDQQKQDLEKMSLN